MLRPRYCHMPLSPTIRFRARTAISLDKLSRALAASTNARCMACGTTTSDWRTRNDQPLCSAIYKPVREQGIVVASGCAFAINQIQQQLVIVKGKRRTGRRRLTKQTEWKEPRLVRRTGSSCPGTNILLCGSITLGLGVATTSRECGRISCG